MSAERRPTEPGDGFGSISEAILGSLGERDRGIRSQAVTRAAREADPDELVDAVADQANSLRRNAAISALTKAGVRSVPALVRALAHDDPEVVMFAASILGKTRDRAAVPQLLQLLDSHDINIAAAAVEGLGRLRASLAVSPLIRMLDRDPWLCFAAVHALGEIGDPRATGALAPLLDDEAIRDVAIEALGKIASLESFDHLSRLLRDCDERTFSTCLRSLSLALEHQPDDSALDQIETWHRLRTAESSEVHMRLLRVLAADNSWADATTTDAELKSAAATVIRALRLKRLYTPLVLAGRDATLRGAIQFSAVSIGAAIADSLSVGIAYENDNVRVLACHCIGALRLCALAPRVEELLRNPQPAVRETAVQTLARLGHYDALPAMVSLLDDAAPTVRDAAQASLCQMDAERVTVALFAREPDFNELSPPTLRAWLAIMRASPHESHVEFLRWCFRNADASVRRAAIAAIAGLPAYDFVGDVEALLDDPDVDVRREAITVLARRRSPRVRTLLLAQLARDAETMSHTVRSLADLNDPTVAPHLIKCFERESAPARLAIIEALAELRDPAAEPLLVRLLADPDEEIRRTAVKALSAFATPTVMRHIVAASRDVAWEVRAAVAEALAGADGDAALAALDRLSLDRNHVVASIARERLAEAGVDE